MKHILIIFILILLPSTIYAQIDISDTVVGVGYEPTDELLRAKGAVAEIRVIKRNPAQIEKTNPDRSALFDKSGKMTERIYNTINPAIAQELPFFKLSYKYRRDGRIRQRLTTDTMGKVRLEYSYNYTYETPNKLTRVVNIKNNDGKPVETTTNKLDSKGRIIEKIIKSHIESSTTIERYEYDENGCLSTAVKLISVPSKGEDSLKVLRKTRYIHDKSQDKTHSLSYMNGKPEPQITDDLLNIDTLDNTHPLINNADVVLIRTRNKMGDVSEMTIIDNNKQANLKCTYTYDAHGNWTTKRLLLTGGQKPIFIYERTIKYHK